MTALVEAPLGTAQARTAARPAAAVGLSALGVVLAAYAASRVALVVAAFVLAARHHTGVLSSFTVWDSGYYLGIASFGYPTHVPILPPGKINASPSAYVAFFPGFPYLGKALAWVTGLPLAWAMVALTWLAGAVGALAATVLVARHYGARAGMQAGVLLAVFPGSVVDGLIYADGVAVAFALAALLAADRRRDVLAGLLGAGATATLSLMLVPLVLALSVAALVTRRWRGLVSAVLTACGAGAYLCWLWAVTGSPFTWSRVEHAGWMVHLSLPWSSGTAFDAYAFSAWGVTALTVGSIVVAAVGLVLLAVQRAPLPWIVLSVLVLAGVTFDGGAWLAPRFVFDAFPLVLACGIAVPRRALWPVAAISTVLLVLLLVAYNSPPALRLFLNV